MKNARKITRVWMGVLVIVVLASVAYASEIVDIEPSADAFVHESYPDTNYGTETLLRVRDNATQDACSYLKFFVMGPGDVTDANLWMRVEDSAITTTTLYSVSDISWLEMYITYNNKPAMGSSIETKTSLQSGTWYEFDVSSVVTEWGYVTFGLDTTQDADQLDWCSRESDYSPYLRVTFDGSTYTPPSLSSLDIFDTDNNPQGAFFRQPDTIVDEVPSTGYTTWRSMFNQLHGIIGKITNEVADYAYPTLMEYFNQFKLDYSDQMVLHQGAINARSMGVAWEIADYESCHFLHYEGQKITANVSTSDTIIYVEDAHYFSGPPFKATPDQCVIHALSGGVIDWDTWEYVKVMGVDVANKKLTVTRAMHDSTARSFTANQAYISGIAAVSKTSSSKFRINMAKNAPKDSENKNGIDRFMDNYEDWYANGGILERLDGIVFDVDMFSPEQTYMDQGWRHLDVDGDMEPDAGFLNGLNDFALGRIDQTQELRTLVGTNRILMGDIQNPGNQRLVWLYNGGETEGFPSGAGAGNPQGDQWSNGVNRLRFWMANAVEPRLCYGGVRTVDCTIQQMRHKSAGLAILDSFPGMYTESDGKPFDEMVLGVDDQLNWLGAPVGSGRQLAVENNNDMLNGAGVNLTTAFMNSWSSDNANITKVGNELKFDGKYSSNTMTATYDSIALDSGSLIVAFDVRADSLTGYPSQMPRILWAHADEVSNLTVLPLLDANFVFNMDGSPETKMDVMDLASRKPSVVDLSLDTYAQVRWLECNDVWGYCVTFPSFDSSDNPVVYWEKTVDLPAQNRELEYGISVQENPWRGSSLGDVDFEVYVNDSLQKTSTYSTSDTLTWRTVDLSSWADETVTIRFQASPGTNYAGGCPFWGPAWIIPKDTSPSYDRSNDAAHLLQTWVNDDPFDASFYFRDMGEGTFNISLSMEGDESVYISNFRIFNTEDRWVREYENGVILVNPAHKSKIFNLTSLFPGQTFSRIQGTQNQDPTTNDGSSVGETVSIPEKDGLFLVKGWTQLTYDDFESGWGNFTDGGNDCLLYTDGTHAHQGTAAADIQDDTGESASFYHTSGIDIDTSGYTQIKVEFWFKCVSMDNSSEGFCVDYYDGTDWNEVASYYETTDFNNDTFYDKTGANAVFINEGTGAGEYTFPTDAKIRFRCDASGDKDDAYIDEVKVSARCGVPEADTTPPANPTGLAATAGYEVVALDWNDNTESDLDGYNVYRSTTSGSGYAKINVPLVRVSDYTDNTVSNDTTYYYKVTAVDTDSNESGYSSEASATPDNNFQFNPSDDAHVKEASPNSNFGSETNLLVRGPGTSHQIDAYLKFVVTNATGTVSTALLKIRSEVAIDDTTVKAVSDTSWSEDSVKWNNRPAMGSTLDTESSISASTWYSFDVTSHITGNGTFSLGLTGTENEAALGWSSKESAYDPVLDVTLE